MIFLPVGGAFGSGVVTPIDRGVLSALSTAACRSEADPDDPEDPDEPDDPEAAVVLAELAVFADPPPDDDLLLPQPAKAAMTVAAPASWYHRLFIKPGISLLAP